jgi:hypothetical protein
LLEEFMMNLEILNKSQIQQFRLDYSSCAINIAQMISSMGYDDETVPDPVLESLESIINILPSKVDLQSGFKLFNQRKFVLRNEDFSIDNRVFHCGKIIRSNLDNSNTLVFIVSSLGSGLESLAKDYTNSYEILKGYLTDKIGSELVEILADKTEIYLQEYLDQFGLKITNRYSPGYCGWNTSDQKKFFSLLPDKFCDVVVTEDSLMIPMKSVSAIIGIGKNAERKNYQCSICDLDLCYKRDRNE